MTQRETEKKLNSDRKELFSNLRRSIRSKSVLSAMQRVPREAFVPTGERPMAYLDVPLTIGEGQTISQPYIVALITEALRLQPADRVLEVGAGSGYQAAVLAEMVPEGKVVTVEVVRCLAQRARDILNDLDYENIVVEDADLGDYPEDERHYSGTGKVLDLDHLMIHGQEGSDCPFPCRYFGDDLPTEGVVPTEFEHQDAE